MTADVATLAQRFARALEHLRATHDLQYVSARPLPAPAPASVAASEAAALEVSEPPGSPSAAAMPSPAPVAPSSDQDPRAAFASPPEPPPPRVASPSRAPDPRPAFASPPEPPPPPAVTSAPPPSASPAGAAVTSASPAAGGDDARRSLREQAQRWTPAKKLEYLRDHNVGDCQRCPLARTRNHIVFGVGNPHAEVMFVGEAPGADEDRQGEPFVGRAGQLLNQWLAQLGLARDDVYIANVLKCRPPGNRDPRPEEVDRCSPFLQAQIRAIEPKVIVALGRHAGMLLSRREDLTLRAMRQGRLHYDVGATKGEAQGRAKGEAQGRASNVMIPLVVTYHPAYVLRQEGEGRSSAPGQPSATELVMSDLRRALAIARGE